MRRTVVGPRMAAVVVLLLLGTCAGAQSLNEFSKIVDFGATLETLNKEASSHKAVSTGGRLVILTGVAASLENLSNNPKQFSAMIELVDGKWHGLQSVSLYRAYVLVQGPRFSSQVLLRPVPNPPPNAVRANSQILVVGTVRTVIPAPDGGEVPVVEAYLVRPID